MDTLTLDQSKEINRKMALSMRGSADEYLISLAFLLQVTEITKTRLDRQFIQTR